MHDMDIKRPLMVNKEVVYTQVESEIVMMDPNNGSYHGLNPVAAALWMKLEDNPMSMEDMVTYLKETYTLKEETAMADASAFVQAMLGQSFLVFSDEKH